MQYVRSISGSVSKTWNSINPATLSGAIDVIVVEHGDGTLACSPFHVRFGKWSLLRPFEKKVEFTVNGKRQDFAMKLGEGGEAFFVFETSSAVPEALQTSPLVSPAASPEARPVSNPQDTGGPDPEPLDLYDEAPKDEHARKDIPSGTAPLDIPERRYHNESGGPTLSQSFPSVVNAVDSMPWDQTPSLQDQSLPEAALQAGTMTLRSPVTLKPPSHERSRSAQSASPPLLPRHRAVERAMTLSKKLKNSNIATRVNEDGDLMLDMTGYKSGEEEVLRAEALARQILSDELEGQYDIGSLIGADEEGHIWIYSSEEARAAAARRSPYATMVQSPVLRADAISDPGYHSDDDLSQKSLELQSYGGRRESDSTLGLSPPSQFISAAMAEESSKNYAKTLRLTSDQLKSLELKPGPNPVSFSVNRATCNANMYLWKHSSPIVVSDVDGTITKSDALGHVLNMIGRDWTHLGVAKLFSDIVQNGYQILYLTSRSVGQADTTRAYLNGISQEGYKLPKGPVIMSPDRTMAALRREIYLRKPEVFKMACLRDIMSLFGQRTSPFYAGFGNRLTDALSYRSVNIPPTRIFTINTNSEVSLDLLSLNKYRTGYASMREIVDHFFPPIGMLIQEGGEDYTDFNYWRDRPQELDEISLSESENTDEDILSDELGESYISRDSLEDPTLRQLGSSLNIRLSTDLQRIDSDDNFKDVNNDTADEEELDTDARDLVNEAVSGPIPNKNLHSS